MQSANRFEHLFTLFDISLRKPYKVSYIVKKVSKILVFLPYIATSYSKRFGLQANFNSKKVGKSQKKYMIKYIEL